MKLWLLVLILFQVNSLFAGPPVDVIFDIDQTLGTLVHDGPNGDLLQDPKNPLRGTINLTYDEVENGKVTSITERYRVYDHMVTLMEELKRKQAAGLVRVSFFSGGSRTRNLAFLKSIKLSDGSSLADLAYQINSREDLTPTGVKEGKIRDKFKKELRKINPDLSDVVIVDDIKEFVPNDQSDHVLWLDEKFPYPEKFPTPDQFPPSAALVKQERNKYHWISEKLLGMIDKRYKENVSIKAQLVELHQTKATPLVSGQEKVFAAGRKRLADIRRGCVSPLRQLLLELN